MRECSKPEKVNLDADSQLSVPLSQAGRVAFARGHTLNQSVASLAKKGPSQVIRMLKLVPVYQWSFWTKAYCTPQKQLIVFPMENVAT